ncbi:7506_t:CDS:2 [Scutellospora calospora]|uniref:7506_t:CDS:1 n=1 Tax=Scutellospora calospora TaxID=85575 RepID=A0ACA9LNI3_9GLOM|nr:7506_t:CDS:2 [Scutellospora calospora]
METIIIGLIVTIVAIFVGTFALLANKVAMIRDPLQAWNELNKPIIRHFRPLIYSYFLEFKNPFVKCIHMRITNLEKGTCSGVLKEQRRIHNPFNSIHAAALCTFAETIGGLAVLSKITKQHRAIVTRINMEYFKKSRGLITGTSTFNPGELNGIQECETILKDQSEDIVAKATVFWNIRNS